ncbi:MAG: S8 family serine peptidase, partial [Chloroflexi bacterium]|nr:S8 family serine peptidase [Chloroflexota bacterium]
MTDKLNIAKSVNWGGKVKRLNLLVVMALMLSLLMPMAAPLAQSAARVQPLLLEMAAQQPGQMVSVIVQKSVKDDRVEQAVGALGGLVTKDLHIINAFVAEMKAKDVAQLAKAAGVRWVSLDAPVQSSAVGDATVRDEFSVASFNNNHGTKNWAAGWTETGDGSSSATSGYVKIASGQLQLSSTSRKLSRQANLSGASSATLSFQYKRNGLDDASDYIAIEVSANGGTSWTEVARYVGPGTDSAWQTASFNILAYASSNTTIRFATSSSLGATDFLHADNVQIEYAQGPVPAGASDGTVGTGSLVNAYNKAIGADKLWNYGYQGSSVTVAVVDSGNCQNDDTNLKTCNDLLGPNNLTRVVGTRSLWNGDVPTDLYGHGSLIEGVVGGSGLGSGGRYIGIAPKVNLVAVRVASNLGEVQTSDVVAGLQWVLDNKATYNIRVVNLSLNGTVAESYHTNPLSAACEILWFNGIVVVVSAGNNGTATLYPPANDPFVITVGATDDKGTSSLTDDVLASFSAYGTDETGAIKPDLVAPGTNLISIVPKTKNKIWKDHQSNYTGESASLEYYMHVSGTSFSAPVVSGAIALLLQDEPNLTPDQIKYRLKATANKTWPGYNATTAGAGYLDIYAAVVGTSTQSANTGLTASQLLWTGSTPPVW